MTEKLYDSMLVHVYSQPNHEGEIKLDIRGHMQVMAAAMLYKSGEAKNFFIAGGNIFGQGKPSASDIYKRELIKRGIPKELIHTQPIASETGQELQAFQEESQAKKWKSLGSIATRTHTDRIRFIHDLNGINNVEIISTEDVLRRERKLTKFLGRFRISNREFIFWHREKLVMLLYKFSKFRYGSIERAKNASSNPIVQKIKDFLDR